MLFTSNPEYRALAYRRSILVEMANMVRRHYLTDDAGNAPRLALKCEHVFENEAQVPPEAWNSFLFQLEEEATRAGVEMAQFQLVRKQNEPEPETTPRVSSTVKAERKPTKGRKG